MLGVSKFFLAGFLIASPFPVTIIWFSVITASYLVLNLSGSSDDIGKIGKVTITPDPPQKGSDIAVEADVTLSKIPLTVE